MASSTPLARNILTVCVCVFRPKSKELLLMELAVLKMTSSSRKCGRFWSLSLFKRLVCVILFGVYNSAGATAVNVMTAVLLVLVLLMLVLVQLYHYFCWYWTSTALLLLLLVELSRLELLLGSAQSG